MMEVHCISTAHIKLGYCFWLLRKIIFGHESGIPQVNPAEPPRPPFTSPLPSFSDLRPSPAHVPSKSLFKRFLRVLGPAFFGPFRDLPPQPAAPQAPWPGDLDARPSEGSESTFRCPRPDIDGLAPRPDWKKSSSERKDTLYNIYTITPLQDRNTVSQLWLWGPGR